jgi:hypothetical protein
MNPSLIFRNFSPLDTPLDDQIIQQHTLPTYQIVRTHFTHFYTLCEYLFLYNSLRHRFLFSIHYYFSRFDGGKCRFYFYYFIKFLLQSVFFNVSFFISEKEIGVLDNTIRSCFWSPSSTTNQVKESIMRYSKYVTYLIILITFLGILAGIVIIPIGRAVDHQFAMFFFRTYLPNFHYLLDIIYCLSFIVTGHTIVNWANMIAYYCYLSKCQLTLYAEAIKYLCVKYEDQDDDSLFYSKEYQQIIKDRIRFIIIRHIELLR